MNFPTAKAGSTETRLKLAGLLANYSMRSVHSDGSITYVWTDPDKILRITAEGLESVTYPGTEETTWVRTALQVALEKRQGHGISDEDQEAYCLGFNDALGALTSDEVYYSAAVNAKQSAWFVVHAVALFLKEGSFELPDQQDEDEEL